MANIAIFRINYKSDFILTLNSDAGWMTPFCIKFWTGAPSQAYFVGYDGETYTHCAPVDGEPTKLLVQFDDHHLPIGDLKFQIAYHFTVADFPNDTEDEVINPANITTEIDGQTYQVMLDFTGETAPEIEFSLPAYANEAQRIANEEQRIAHEQQRINDEQQRIANEETRQAKEAQRIAQETARVNEFATLKSQSQAATSAANAAAALANEKAQLAADKAALADAAAILANQKAQLAADKAALANAAAQLANEKAALAQQKAEYAQQQGGYAKDQGDYAKDQGDYAKAQGTIAEEDHQRAEVDHGIAVDDHTQAGNDHTRAESDHGIAVDDHTQAGNDHTRAESDHGIAADDHTQAGTDHQTAAADHQTAGADHTQAGNDHTRAESDHTRAESDHDAVELYVDSLGVFDLSKHNAVGGVLATYADLSAALTALNALESKYKYGGMSFKFVQSSDNKYVQYRLMSDTFNTNVTQWQGVDDEPTAGSNNLVKSGGVKEDFNNLREDIGFSTEIDIDNIPLKDWMLGETNWYANNNGKHVVIPVREGYTYFIKSTSASRGYIGWLTSEYVEPTSASAIPYVSGTQRVQPSSTGEYYAVPEGAAYLCINRREYSLVYTYDIDCKKVESVIKSIEDVASDVEAITSDVEAITEESIVNYIAQGTIYNGVVSPNKECLYSKLFYKVKPSQTINITRASDILVRINEYKENGEYYRGGNNTYTAIDSVTLGEQTAYIQISASYVNRSESVTINDYIEGDFGIKLDNPIYSKQVFNAIRSIEENINELQQAQTIDILKLSYVQGSLYQNNLENNSKCITCLDYIGIEDLKNTLVVTNQKQQDGKYWKVRVTFCDDSKTYIKQEGYTFIEGSWNIPILANMKYARISISLIDSDGTDLSCTPADIPTDGTKILLNKSSVAFLLKGVTELHQDVTELQQDVSELKSFYEPIPLNRLLGYSFTHLFNVTSGYGDAACYNGLIFQFINGNEYVYVHDAADGTLVQTITMPNPNSAYHNNSVSFGSEKYDEADTYPLLYASQENSAQNKCIVYRVTGTIGNLTLEVVQTITYPANYVTQLYYHNCYIDTKNNYLILGGLVNSSWSATDGNTLQYMAFALPALASGNVTLDMANVLFKSPRFANMPTTQGGFCKNGYLYQVFGVSAPQLFMVFDIKHCKFCYVFNFTEELMNAEPEGAFEYDNKVCVVFNGGAVYKLNP